MEKLTGKLFYNEDNDRMDILYDNGDVLGGLHCGETLDVKINDVWIPTRIEMAQEGAIP